MNSTPSSQSAAPRNVAGHVPGHVPGSAPGSIPSALLPGDTGFHPASPLAQGVPASAELGPRRVGYGLPCVKCKTYYAADLSACPVCKTEERVLPLPLASVNSSPRLAEAVAPSTEDIALEEERERFLREFKARVYASDGPIEPQIDAQIDAPADLGCSLEVSHHGEFEPASICEICYARLQRRVDLLEAALHIDLKEATQVVYDAVWSDPSDPSKTYHNAAQAILLELHRRAGISAVLGPLQPLAH